MSCLRRLRNGGGKRCAHRRGAGFCGASAFIGRAIGPTALCIASHRFRSLPSSDCTVVCFCTSRVLLLFFPTSPPPCLCCASPASPLRLLSALPSCSNEQLWPLCPVRTSRRTVGAMTAHGSRTADERTRATAAGIVSPPEHRHSKQRRSHADAFVPMCVCCVCVQWLAACLTLRLLRLRRRICAVASVRSSSIWLASLASTISPPSARSARSLRPCASTVRSTLVMSVAREAMTISIVCSGSN